MTDLITAENIVLRYPAVDRPVLDRVSVKVRQGITLGIVGESGSGKSSLARCLLGLEKIESGRICFNGRDIHAQDTIERREFRRQVQMVFQDPFNSLNPRMKIGQILTEVLRVHRLVEKHEIGERIAGILDQVGLNSSVVDRYPHELSGGQRQRVGIARALSLKPSVVIADEPVSALDVSVQAQILNLLVHLVKNTGITLVLIAHDLAVIRYVCHEIAVMKQGIIVEEGAVSEVMERPQHPYTKELLAAVPEIRC